MANTNIFQNHFMRFALAPPFPRYYVTKFDLENLGQGHVVYNAHCCHSMENITVYKSYTMNFPISIIISKILPLKNFDLRNLGQGYREQHLSDPIRWRMSPSIKEVPHIFALALTVFEILTSKFRPLKN